MRILEFIAPVFLGLLAIEHIVVVIYFMVVNHLRRHGCGDGELPNALVILKLRGADPFLPDCVRGLINQDYPRYQARIVIDSRQDPAWSVVHDVLAETPAGHVEVSELVDPPGQCSLVCSAVYQATDDLPEGCEAVAMLDADVVPHPTWLRELVAPLREPRIGVTRGYRWFAPEVGKWGSWVRYLWNIVVEITAFNTSIAWGGCMAVKTSILRETDLRERWLKSANEDSLVGRAMRQLRLRLRCVPRLVMVNREECDLAGSVRFMQRQQIWGRLYCPLTFWTTAVAFSLISAAQVFSIVMGILCLLDDNWVGATMNLLCVPIFFSVQVILVIAMEWFIRRLIAGRGQQGARLRLKTFLAIFLGQCCAPFVAARSMFARKYVWRGVEYDVLGPWNVRVHYTPFTDGQQAKGGEELPATSREVLDSL